VEANYTSGGGRPVRHKIPLWFLIFLVYPKMHAKYCHDVLEFVKLFNQIEVCSTDSSI